MQSPSSTPAGADRARIRVAAMPLLAAFAALSAQAMPVATLTDRTAVTFVEYAGGFAVAGDHGSDGSALPLTSLQPTALDLSGTHTFLGSYQGWQVTYTVNWALTQQYAIDPGGHVLSAQGAVHLDESSAVVGPNCSPCAATVAIGGTNTQRLDFALDAATAYSFHSENTLNQWTNMSRWDLPSGKWVALWIGPLETQGKVFDRSDMLAAGLYRLDNNPYTFVADGVPPSQDNAWSYALTLPDASFAAAVPEPSTWALWLLGGVALIRRRRAAPIRRGRAGCD